MNIVLHINDETLQVEFHQEPEEFLSDVLEQEIKVWENIRQYVIEKCEINQRNKQHSDTLEYSRMKTTLKEIIFHYATQSFNEPIKLKNGTESYFVVDTSRILRDPKFRKQIHSILTETEAYKHINGAKYMCGPTTGGDLMCSIVNELEWFCIRDVAKGRGLDVGRLSGSTNEIYSYNPTDKIIILEDVITSGKTVASCIDALNQEGLDGSGMVVLSLVERVDHGARELMEKLGIEFHSVFQIHEDGKKLTIEDSLKTNEENEEITMQW